MIDRRYEKTVVSLRILTGYKSADKHTAFRKIFIKRRKCYLILFGYSENGLFNSHRAENKLCAENYFRRMIGAESSDMT